MSQASRIPETEILQAGSVADGTGDVARCRSLHGRPQASDLVGLRAAIQRIECKHRKFVHAAGETEDVWRSGVADLDARLGPLGLIPQGVHHCLGVPPEDGPPLALGTASTQAFMLALAALQPRPSGSRMAHDEAGSGKASAVPQPDIVWCTRTGFAREFGGLSHAGLSAFGLDPTRFLVVETRRDDEVLWVLEEALRAGAMTLAIGVVQDIALTPARRLALAADEGATPLLLMTDPRAGGVAASATRWRISPLPSAPHPFAETMPGNPRFAVTLERCRTHTMPAATHPFALEWCHDTYAFRMARELSDRATAPPRSGEQSGDVIPLKIRTAA